MGMKIWNDPFHKRTKTGIGDQFMRQAVRKAQDGLRIKKLKATESLGNWEEWRALGEEIRKHTLENLDYYLYELSENIEKNGGFVYFAKTGRRCKGICKRDCKKEKCEKNCEIKIDGNRRD